MNELLRRLTAGSERADIGRADPPLELLADAGTLRLIGGGPRWTVREIARRLGTDRAHIERAWEVRR